MAVTAKELEERQFVSVEYLPEKVSYYVTLEEMSRFLTQEKEHKYPHFEEWDHFLDDNMNRFDIQEW